MNTTEANGLRLVELDSQTEPENIPENTLQSVLTAHFPEKSFVVAWLDYTVLIGTWERHTFRFYDHPELKQQYIQKLRVFDEEQELFVWRTSGRLRGRLRKDDRQGSGTQVIVAHQVLFGTRKGKHGDENFTEITEDRGTSLILPFTNLKFVKNNKQQEILRPRVCITTHNYLKPNPVGQMTYIDCRFVRFTDSNKMP